MARSNTGSASNWLSNAAAARAALPMTLVTWARLANVTHTASLLNITNGAGDQYVSLTADGANEYGGGAGRIIADPAGTNVGVSTAAYTANTWFHAAAVFASITSRTAYLNGANAGSTTTSYVLGTPTTTSLGGFRTTSTTFGPMNGRMAEAAVYDVALTADEILQLAKGYSPLLVRPDALVAYWPLVGRQSPERDLVGAFPLTINGTMAQAEHVGIIMPRAPWIGRTVSSSGVVIQATPGAATAAGVAARANLHRVISAGPGAAAAAGTPARVNLHRLIAGAAGAASAQGVSATFILNRLLSASAGAASAAGVAATILRPVIVSAGPGLAGAAGVAAVVNLARLIPAGPGAASAAAASTRVDLGRFIAANPGAAAAVGVQARINAHRIIAAGPGVASAAGVQAQISVAGAVVIQAGPGAATAAGSAARVDQARLITASPGGATANGTAATLEAGIIVQASPGAAAAVGTPAQILAVGDVVIAAGPGAAVAAGATAGFGEPDDLYPLAGLSETFPLAGESETYPLQGLN